MGTTQQRHTSDQFPKKIVERLILLMETVKQGSNYMQISSQVRDLLRLSSVYAAQLFF